MTDIKINHAKGKNGHPLLKKNVTVEQVDDVKPEELLLIFSGYEEDRKIAGFLIHKDTLKAIFNENSAVVRALSPKQRKMDPFGYNISAAAGKEAAGKVSNKGIHWSALADSTQKPGNYHRVTTDISSDATSEHIYFVFNDAIKAQMKPEIVAAIEEYCRNNGVTIAP